jgi:hypothetical protein
MSQSQPPKPRWQSRALIVVIALTAVVPFTLAWYYARHPELIEKTSNYGTLIQPVRQLDVVRLLSQPLSAVDELAQIRGRWVLLQIAADGCGPECAETLHKTHQGWLMLNKEMPRVKRLLLVEPSSGAAESPAVKADDALLIAGSDPAVMREITAALGKPLAEGMVVLLDPLGNLVLWYDGGFDPYKMVKDLKHLLKASQIG